MEKRGVTRVLPAKKRSYLKISLARIFRSMSPLKRRRRRRLSINWTREFVRIITNLLCVKEKNFSQAG